MEESNFNTLYQVDDFPRSSFILFFPLSLCCEFACFVWLTAPAEWPALLFWSLNCVKSYILWVCSHCQVDCGLVYMKFRKLDKILFYSKRNLPKNPDWCMTCFLSYLFFHTEYLYKGQQLFLSFLSLFVILKTGLRFGKGFFFSFLIFACWLTIQKC